MFLFSQAREGSFSFPVQASTFAEDVDGMYAFIFWISLFFFVVINILMVYFVVKYRRKPGQRLPEKSPSHHTLLELAWTILPSFLLVFMFVQGAFGYLAMRTPPQEAAAVERTINVRAFKYGWQFEYPNGDVTTELHLARNEAVRFRISAKDALHSFYIREFRIKMDCVPGRYTECWVTPTMLRTPDETLKSDGNGNVTRGDKEPFHLQCAEYCGTGHSKMRTEWDESSKKWLYPVYVHDCSFDELAQFTAWKKAEKTPWQNGQHLYTIKGCIGCHAVENQSGKAGPNFKTTSKPTDERVSTTGEQRVFDDDYIRESINYSSKFIVSGYPNQMPKFNLNEEELSHLITFIRSPSEDPVPGVTLKDLEEGGASGEPAEQK